MRQGVWCAGAAVLLAGLGAAPAWADDVVFLVADSYAMPLARQNKKDVQEGIFKDVGDAIAARLGGKAVFKVAPRDKLVEVLQAGDADLVCNSRPEWMTVEGGKWSGPFLPVGDLVVLKSGGTPIGKVQDLAGKKVATIKGYKYPELEAALGDKFVRADGTDIASSLNKVRLGVVEYAIVDELVYYYQRKTVSDSGLSDKAFRLTDLKTQCVLSGKSKLPASKVFAAIDELGRSGIKKILDKYR